MTIAFAGDPARKAMVLDALARGEGFADGDTLASQSGIPLPIAALLLVLAPRAADGEAAFLHAALATVVPGADLAQAPTRLALFLLDAPEIAGSDGLIEAIRALHRQQLDGAAPDRDAWKQVRRAALLPADAAADGVTRARAAMSEAACWPAERDRSTLTAMLRCWVDLAALEADADWSEADGQRSAALLDRLWNEHGAAREAGEPVHYAKLFYAADHDLARRYEANLTRTNRRVAERYTEFGAMLVRTLAEAPVRSDFAYHP